MNIFYRLCEERRATHAQDDNHRPNWFTKSNCLKSFLKSLDESKKSHNITFVFDGQRGSLYNEIPKDFRVEMINGGNYYESLRYTYLLANQVNNDDDFYFVEDDYLHLPNSIESISNAVKKFGLVSGYDHLARYDPVRYSGNNDTHYILKITYDELSNHHWRTNESVCHTYAVSGNLFRKHFQIIMRHDCISHDQNLFRAMYLEGITLWTAIPGLVTQVDPYMSPCIDWEKFNGEL